MRRWNGAEDIPLEADKVGHCTNGEVRHKVHSARVDLVDGGLPVCQGTPVWVKQGEVEWGIGKGASVMVMSRRIMESYSAVGRIRNRG